MRKKERKTAIDDVDKRARSLLDELDRIIEASANEPKWARLDLLATITRALKTEQVNGIRYCQSILNK